MMWVSAKKVIRPLIGDTILPPSMLHEMIAPAESDPANTRVIPVKTIATVIKLDRVPLMALVILDVVNIAKLRRIEPAAAERHSRR